jgi:hypothetical protein
MPQTRITEQLLCCVQVCVLADVSNPLSGLSLEQINGLTSGTRHTPVFVMRRQPFQFLQRLRAAQLAQTFSGLLANEAAGIA